MIVPAIAKLVDRKDLTFDEARESVAEIFGGHVPPSQIAGFLIALRMKGETVDEITGALITWNHGTEQFSVQGGTPSAGNPGGRVRAVLSPRPAASGATR